MIVSDNGTDLTSNAVLAYRRSRPGGIGSSYRVAPIGKAGALAGLRLMQ